MKGTDGVNNRLSDSEERRVRSSDGGVMPTARDQRTDLVPLKGKVQWHG